jgi:hypothetical protein
MYRLALLFSVLITLNAAAKTNNDSYFFNIGLDTTNVNSLEHEIETSLFDKDENLDNQYLEIDSIEVIELEEEVNFDFDITDYLPENFNALKGKHDLDLKSIEVIEIEEEIEFDFETKSYLPNNFNPYKGMYSTNIAACLY